jgi:phospholipid/cholesterol/gamma-HCH transport system ATP-binding protein
MPSNGLLRAGMHAPGAWCAAHGVTPPPGSFIDDLGRNWVEEWPRYVASMTSVGAASGGAQQGPGNLPPAGPPPGSPPPGGPGAGAGY